MGKAVGAMVAMFSVGGVSMTLLTGVLGGFAECVALGLVGVGLVASSHLLGARVATGTASPITRGLGAEG